MSSRPNIDHLKFSLLFAAFWLVLTGGRLDAWVIGIIVVPLAAWSAVALRPKTVKQWGYRIRIRGLFKFVPYFLWQSLVGGIASARMALQPQHVAPGFMCYRTTLPEGPARVFFLHVISLLPGTVSADREGDQVYIHALDSNNDHNRDLLACENQVRALYGLHSSEDSI